MPPRILLVDDDDLVRDSLYMLLESAGYEVLSASNAPDGLTIFRQSIRPVDLLVTDFDPFLPISQAFGAGCSARQRLLRAAETFPLQPNQEFHDAYLTNNSDFVAGLSA